MLKVVICNLTKIVKTLKQVAIIYAAFCLANQQKYLMKKLNHLKAKILQKYINIYTVYLLPDITSRDNTILHQKVVFVFKKGIIQE